MKRDYSAKIEQLKLEGYTFSIRDVLNKSFQLFKKSAGLYIAFLFILIAVSVVLGLIPIYETFVNLLNSYIIGPVFITGLLAFTYKNSRNEDVKMSDFFSTIGEFKEYGLAYFITRIITALPIIAMAFIFMQQSGIFYDIYMNNTFDINVIKQLDLGGLFIFLFIVCVSIVIYLSVSYSLVLPFFLFNDRDKTILEALEDLRKITQKKLFKFIGLGIALVFLNLLGALALLVGLLVTIPVSLISLFVIFDEIFGTGDADENRDFEFEELKWE
jgi:hypothetical protein